MIEKLVELFRQFLISLFGGEPEIEIPKEEINESTLEEITETPIEENTGVEPEIEPIPEPIVEEIVTETKSIDELAQEVLDGKWGSGKTRKAKLTEAGYDYEAVQEKVNEIIAEREAKQKAEEEEAARIAAEEAAARLKAEYEALIDKLAHEVLDGKWGSGDKRKENLEAAGYNYNAVQNRVNDILKIVDEVLEGKWGTGDTRKERLEAAGYDYYFIQELINKRVNSKDVIVANMNSWAKKIASDNSYHYKVWESSDNKTHLCPVCNNYPAGKYHGWNCIGFGAAVWHHGGGLKSKCNCSVISDSVGEKMLQVSDAEALKIAKQRFGLDDLKVIRNKDGIPKSQWEAGDICLKFSGDTYKHLFYYMGNGKIADSIGSNGKVANNDQIAIRSYDNYSAKIIIRWIGTSTTSVTSEPEKKFYSGELPTLKLVKTNAEVINDACRWATWIAGDNRFHYGYTNKHGSSDPKKWSPNAHHNGCYFCGTNTTSGGRSKKGITDYQRTYCCNPFVHAAWAHGGCIPKALSICRDGSSWDYHKGKGYDSSSLFTNLGKPAKSKLKKGDVCCNDSHIFLYIGNGKVAEAASGDDNVRNSTKWNNSIHITNLSDSKYKGVKRVHRYNSSVNTEALIRHGEISNRVAQWQAFLDWLYDGQVGSADGIYGDNTLNWTKKFQEEYIGAGQGDGIIGNKTLEAAANVEK